MNKIRFALPLIALPLAALAAACTGADQAAVPQQLVRDLIDRSEITALVDQLGRALDEGRFDDFTAIYTPDATARTPGGRAEGRDALIAQASRNHTADKRVQHFISNVMVELRGDTAEVRANLFVTFTSADPQQGIAPAPQFTLGEIYRFDAIRTAEGWRLSRVETTPLWSTGVRP